MLVNSHLANPCLLGIVSNLWKQDTRGTSGLILGSVGVFFVGVAMSGPYHTSPRHFIPILPLLACFTYAGIVTILNVLRIPVYTAAVRRCISV